MTTDTVRVTDVLVVSPQTFDQGLDAAIGQALCARNVGQIRSGVGKIKRIEGIVDMVQLPIVDGNAQYKVTFDVERYIVNPGDRLRCRVKKMNTYSLGGTDADQSEECIECIVLSSTWTTHEYDKNKHVYKPKDGHQGKIVRPGDILQVQILDVKADKNRYLAVCQVAS